MLSLEEYEQMKNDLEARRTLKKQQRRKQLFRNIFLVIIGVILLWVSARYSYNKGLRNSRVASVGIQQKSTEDYSYQRIHILFLGIDDKGDTTSRTDTIILAALDPNTGGAGLISIPRDTRVYIQEKDRWDRINAVHAYGGPALTMKTVAEFLDIDIDYYIETDFVGFSKIIDTLGGIEIDVEKDMNYTDTAQNLFIDIKAGTRVLDGKNALDYVRYRDYLGDIALVNPQYEVYGGRVQRQRKFVMALIDEILQPSTILKLPRLLGQLWSAVDTNLPWSLALKLAFAADRFTSGDIVTGVLPGQSELLHGAWYWIPDDVGKKQVVDWVIHGIPLPLTAEVLNGSGVQGVAAALGELLRVNNVDVKRTSNADHFNYPTSEIIVSSKEAADRISFLVDMINAELLIDTTRESLVDVTVIVGKNYQIP